MPFLQISYSKERDINVPNFFHIYHLSIEKAALLSPDDDVQKSDISSSSQGLVEKEALGPMLLEVRSSRTCTFSITIYEICFF